ncbi:MAG: [protein-PII] uridylyltransferase [Pseudomonadota bacterium]
MSESRAPEPRTPRERLAELDTVLEARYWRREQVFSLLAERTALIDALLRELWQSTLTGSELALYAVGGYGRGEMLPKSDLDVLIVGTDPRAHAEPVEAFVHALFDLGLDVGHSVRAVGELRQLARSDQTVATNLFDRRPLVVNGEIAAAIDDALDPRRVWPSDAYYRAKLDEQRRRHARFANTDYELEPNIKESPGGLRDLQTAMWVFQRHFGTADPAALEAPHILTRQERDWLINGRRYLLWVRYGLHLVAGRKEDRLQFEHQRTLARQLGYVDTNARLGVERFMQGYYRHVLTLREVNDIMLQAFDEQILKRRGRDERLAINDRFQLRNGYMEAVSEQVFAEHPSALLELFVLLANRPDVAGVRANTIRAIRANLHLIDDAFRRDDRNTALFLNLLRSPHSVVTQLTRMRRYGVLGRYLPEFGQVVGQMQHDLFHIYTVDQHTMEVIRNMRRFRLRSAERKHPIAAHCVRAITKIELLYIAGLFHDIGKGRGGDHSTLGAHDVVVFCQRHGLSKSDTVLVEWLVQEHLLMSATAQRKDIYDPDVIHAFAQEVKSERRLNYLYALTVADINATNPTLWNNWRATLLRQLYLETKRALRRGLESPLDRDESISETQSWALSRLQEPRGKAQLKALDRVAIEGAWAVLGEDFFLRHTPREVAEITEVIARHDLADGALVFTRASAPQPGEAASTSLFAYLWDRPGIFATLVTLIDRADLSIYDARLVTSDDGRCCNQFVILDEDGNAIDPTRRNQLSDRLRSALNGETPLAGTRSKRLSRRARQLTRPTEVRIENEPQSDSSTLRIIASDRPGLLAIIGQLLAELRINITTARITTLGDRVEDSFDIQATDGEPIVDPQHIYEIENHMRQELDRSVGATPQNGLNGVNGMNGMNG